jgi:hypothetical protein
MSLVRKFTWWLHRRRKDEELREELAFHLEAEADEQHAGGVAEEQARWAARRDLGNVTLLREDARRLWTWRALDDVGQDLAYAARTLNRSRAFTVVAVLTLALGVGANAAMFSITNAILLRPLPFPDADRLFSLGGTDMRRDPPEPTGTSWPDFFDVRARTKTVEHLAGYRAADFTVVSGGRSQYVAGAVVSADFFSALGTGPVRGRSFVRADERAGTDVVIISDALWHAEFGAKATDRPALTINGRRFTVIGVMPPGFRFPITLPAPQLWITAAEDARVEAAGDTPMTSERGARFIRVLGRLRPGTSMAAAQSELSAIAAALASEYPDSNGKRIE